MQLEQSDSPENSNIREAHQAYLWKVSPLPSSSRWMQHQHIREPMKVAVAVGQRLFDKHPAPE